MKGLKTFGHLNGHYLNVNNLKSIRVFSSVGLERYLDRVEVGGSNPSTPTKNKPTQLSGFLLIQELSFLSFIFCIIDQKTIAIPAPKLN